MVRVIQSILKRITRTGELRHRIVTYSAEPAVSGDSDVSEYDSRFVQEEEEDAPGAITQSQKLGEGIDAAREDIHAVQAQVGEIMSVFSMLTEAVYHIPVPAEKAEEDDLAPSEAVLMETISAEIDNLKRQLETTCAVLSKNGVNMLTMETKTDELTAKLSRIEQTLPELISMQSNFSSKITELMNLISMNRSEIMNLAANTERVDFLYESLADMYEIASALTSDVSEIITRLDETEAGDADMGDLADGASGEIAEVEIMPPTTYVKLHSVGNEADHVKIAMELLDFLLEMVGPNNLPSILDYYIEIGWISETARLELLAYASGIYLHEEKPDWKMSTEDHLKALWFIDQLCGHKTDKTRLLRANHEIAKMYKGIDTLYEI
ncbi:MAG TPA: hypothetical protein EYP67_02895 [Methanosarcinales archaeon]|nr:hypothetical protein [Methanosarcinales archaeon]